MAESDTFDDYGNPIDPEEVARRAQQASQGNTVATPSPTPTTVASAAASSPSRINEQGFTRQNISKLWNDWSGGGTISNLDAFAKAYGLERRGRDAIWNPYENETWDLIRNVNHDPNSDIGAVKGVGTGGGASRRAAAAAAAAAARSATTRSAAPAAVAPAQNAGLDQLMADLLARSKQSLEIDRNDPIIRRQADAFAAAQERARRNYLADAAEGLGPNANMRGEERMSAERLAQSVSAQEADLIGRELVARRQEIADALVQRGTLLTAEQQRALTLQLAQMDDAIKRLQVSTQNSQFGRDLAFRGQQLSEQGRQFDTGMGFNYDQFDWARSPLNPANFPRE